MEQLVGVGSEHLVLQLGSRIEADDLAVGVINDAAYRLRSHIVCDVNWNMERVKIQDLLNNRVIDLVRKTNGDWADEKAHAIEALHGCTEVDIMVTPFTNTLPIRRLNLAVGESKEISVVYVSVSDLNISKLNQRYTYLSKLKDGGGYKYENLGSGFSSDITVDADGLVLDYPGIFRRIWKGVER